VLISTLLAVTAYCAVLVVPIVFSFVSSWDDEGTLLMTFRSYVSDGGLYGATYTQYGPAYFAILGSFFEVTGSDLASLVTSRVVTVVLLALTGGVITWALYLASRRFAVPAVGGVFLVAYLAGGGVPEPLHPGHFLGLTLAGLAAALLVTGEKWRVLAALVAGGLVAILAATKINVGGLALLGIVLGVGAIHPKRTAKMISLGCAVVLPFALILPDFGQATERGLAMVVAAAAVVGWGVAAAGPPSTVHPRSVAAFVVSMVATGLAVVGVVLLKDGSLVDLVRGVFIDPLRQRVSFAVPYLTDPSIWGAVGALVLVSGALVVARRSNSPFGQTAIGIAKFVAGAVVVLLFADDAQSHTLEILLLTSVVAVPLRRYERDEVAARQLLVLVAILQTLHAYPVAGSQVRWGLLLAGVVAFVNLADGLPAIGELATTASPARWMTAEQNLGAATAIVVLLTIGLGALLPRSEYTDYSRLHELSLPGTSGIRLHLEDAEILTRLTTVLDDNCDSYYSMPGLSSPYVYAQMPLVSGSNVGGWPWFFDHDRQRRVVQELEAFDGRLCLVRNHSVLAFWQQGRPDPQGPLVGYLEAFDVEVGDPGGGYRVFLASSGDER